MSEFQALVSAGMSNAYHHALREPWNFGCMDLQLQLQQRARMLCIYREWRESAVSNSDSSIHASFLFSPPTWQPRHRNSRPSTNSQVWIVDPTRITARGNAAVLRSVSTPGFSRAAIPELAPQTGISWVCGVSIHSIETASGTFTRFP